MSRRPIIGYTTPDQPNDPLHIFVALGIWLGGGWPRRLRPARPRLDEQIDGLVISGGTDLYPTELKWDPKPNYVYDRKRDAMEIEWLQKALAEKRPVLGICRGAQLINVHFGGTLHVDVAKVYENANYPAGGFAQIFFRKPVAIEADSQLRSIIGHARLSVNSMHKQAIDQLGEGLQVSAREDNGVVQAVESGTSKFLIGVQFHPEALLHRRAFRNLFRALYRAAKN